MWVRKLQDPPERALACTAARRARDAAGGLVRCCARMRRRPGVCVGVDGRRGMGGMGVTRIVGWVAGLGGRGRYIAVGGLGGGGVT